MVVGGGSFWRWSQMMAAMVVCARAWNEVCFGNKLGALREK